MFGCLPLSAKEKTRGAGEFTATGMSLFQSGCSEALVLISVAGAEKNTVSPQADREEGTITLTYFVSSVVA